MSRERDSAPPRASESLIGGQREFQTRDGIAAFGERYEIEKVLGQGAMGVVLQARDPILERRVAIKLIRPDVVAIPGVLEAFMREAKAMARVNDPNVVRLHEFGKHEGMPYFTMEFIEGTDLDSWLEARELPLSIDRAFGLIEPLCRGVQALHDAGAVHRDLKPGNVLIGPAHRVAVADLGLSAFVEELGERPGLTGGTPEYMAPEVCARQRVDPKLAPAADVYALGVIAFELLVGRLPFEAETPEELMEKHRVDGVPIPSRANPRLPESFDAPLLAALSKDPRTRTQSAEAFRTRMLGALAAAGSVSDRRERPFNVLVADDDPDMLEWLDAQLSFHFPRASIRSAPNGIEAYDALREHMPDIVISDLDMPGIDGAELCAALRDLDEGLSVPLIVITAVGGAPDWARLQALGANGFLAKPLDGDALAALVANTLR